MSQSVISQPVGVILAGGQGRRMGMRDKAWLSLGGRSLLDRAIERLAPQVSALAINANGDPARFSGSGLPVLSDNFAGFAGPLAGILAGLDWAAKTGAESIVTVAVDTPFFPCDLVPQLLLASEGMTCPAAIAASRDGQGAVRVHPVFGLWNTALRGDLREILEAGLRKVSLWADQQSARIAIFPDDTAFFNLNVPDDLIKAETMLHM